MSSRIDISIRPWHWAGALAALPWFGLTFFVLILAHRYSLYFLALSPLTLVGVIYHWRLIGGLSLDRSITGLRVEGDVLQARQRNGAEYPVVADSGSRVYPRLLILRLICANSTHRSSTVLLWADNYGAGNVSADLHRQLRVWLRLGPANHLDGPLS